MGRPSVLPVCLALTVVTAAARADAEPPAPTRKQRRDRITALAVAGGVYLASESLLKESLVPEDCRWCGTNRLDRGVRDALLWGDVDQARRASNVTGYWMAPIATLGLLAVAGSRDDRPVLRFVDDAIPVLEAALYTQLFTQVVKYTTARERPNVHFTDAPSTLEDNLSFISGHTSLAFSLAVSAGMVAHRRRTPFEPIVWGTGLALATATGYLRIAGDKHYVTDVVAGAAVGILGGLLIPKLTGSLPRGPGKRTRLVPAGSGVAFAGVF